LFRDFGQGLWHSETVAEFYNVLNFRPVDLPSVNNRQVTQSQIAAIDGHYARLALDPLRQSMERATSAMFGTKPETITNPRLISLAKAVERE
jgi:hypothetical protein